MRPSAAMGTWRTARMARGNFPCSQCFLFLALAQKVAAHWRPKIGQIGTPRVCTNYIYPKGKFQLPIGILGNAKVQRLVRHLIVLNAGMCTGQMNMYNECQKSRHFVHWKAQKTLGSSPCTPQTAPIQRMVHCLWHQGSPIGDIPLDLNQELNLDLQANLKTPAYPNQGVALGAGYQGTHYGDIHLDLAKTSVQAV